MSEEKEKKELITYGTVESLGFELPSGCLTAKPQSADKQQSTEVESKKKAVSKKKAKMSPFKIPVIILGCIIIGLVIWFFKYGRNTTSDPNQNSTIISTGSDAEKEAEETATQMDATQTDATTEHVTTEFSWDPSTTEADEGETTEAITESLTTEVPVLSGNQILVGGTVVSYEFDSTWTSKVENNTFYAERNTDEGSIVLYVADSNIAVGEATNVRATLVGVENPYQNNTEMTLTASSSCEMRNIMGKTGYVTYYTGTDKDGHTITSMGIMQDIGGSTYVYITIKDSYGYDIDTLINSLAVSVE